MALGTDPIRNHGFCFFHLREWDKVVNGKTLRISHQQWGFNQERLADTLECEVFMWNRGILGHHPGRKWV